MDKKSNLSPAAAEWLRAILKQISFNLTAEQMEVTLAYYKEVAAFLDTVTIEKAP